MPSPVILRELFLRDFRNYPQAFFSFSPKINCIVGENALGKTNLLEAIYLLVTGRSFRTPHLGELIRFGASSFHITAHFEKQGVEQTLKISYDGQARKVVHNATLLPHLSHLLGMMPGVILSPEDILLIKGGPKQRREFLDVQNAIHSPLYLFHLSRYTRALKQRNHLLKNKVVSTLGIWEQQMAPAGAYITYARNETLRELAPLVATRQTALGEKEGPIQLFYRSPAISAKKNTLEEIGAYLQHQLEKQREKDILQRQTTVGPHRDDMAVLLHDREASSFGSEGQVRSLVLSLRLAEWERLKEKTEEEPLFCIDDLGISLDEKRISRLAQYLPQLGQVFLTSPRKDLPFEGTYYIRLHP